MSIDPVETDTTLLSKRILAVDNGTFDCLKKIAAEEGVAAGVYKGFVANAFRSVGAALVLVLYDRAKRALAL